MLQGRARQRLQQNGRTDVNQPMPRRSHTEKPSASQSKSEEGAMTKQTSEPPPGQTGCQNGGGARKDTLNGGGDDNVVLGVEEAVGAGVGHAQLVAASCEEHEGRGMYMSRSNGDYRPQHSRSKCSCVQTNEFRRTRL